MQQRSVIELGDAFFSIAEQVYQQDRLWLGENRAAIENQFKSSNPFFEDGQCWVKTTYGARLAGFIHPNQQIEGEQAAYFGYWETVNELAPNQKLFAEFEQWAKSKGAQQVYGPINFSTHGQYRLRSAGFQERSFQGEPHSPEYYLSLMQQLGYQTKYRYLTYVTEDAKPFTEMIKPRFEQVKANLPFPLHIERLTPEYWLENIEKMYVLADMMFRANFAYTPMPIETFKLMYGQPVAEKLCPKASVLLKNEQQEPIGFFIGFPDYSPVIHAMSDKSQSVSYAEHFEQLPEPKLIIAKTGGVHPDYRSAGLFTLMSSQLMVWAAPYYDHAMAATIREDNQSKQFAQQGEMKREYQLFEKRL